MRITKYGHSCVVLEEQGEKLIIDPGEYTPGLGNIEHVVGIIITHVHPDHFDPAQIAKILTGSPEVAVWTTAEVGEELGNPDVHVVGGGSKAEVGPFRLHFFGELHAKIHDDFPRNQNVGVLVNEAFYYPGDSFTIPDVPVKTLAMPASGPWFKLGEGIDFLREVKPDQCFPTHNALLSEPGNASVNNWINKACEAQHTKFTYLKPGESLEIQQA